MNLREAVGFVFIVLGLCLVPAAWAFSRLLWMLAFVLIAVGTALLYTQRMMKKEEEIEMEGGGRRSSGRCMPTDIHDYTGWSSGGRSETMDSSDGGSGD